MPSQLPTGEALPNPPAGDTEVKEGTTLCQRWAPPSARPQPTPRSPHFSQRGPCWGTVPVLPAGIAQLLSGSSYPAGPAAPAHRQVLPKVMIPLSSIPTYNAAMDSNSFLKNSFHKFPYPTKAELCYLTVVTKYPEEQLKIWFTAQRLKQGISWSPEEIEDARKKMFNTVIQSVPQPTITVLNTPWLPAVATSSTSSRPLCPGMWWGSLEGTAGGLQYQPLMANGLQAPQLLSPLAVTSVSCRPLSHSINTACSNTTSAVKVVNAPSRFPHSLP